MTVRQQVIWLGKWRKRGAAQCADPVTCNAEPDEVWTLFRETNHDQPPKLPIVPQHHVNAFYEDKIHDWTWRHGKLYYHSRVADKPVWVLLVYRVKSKVKLIVPGT